MSPLSVVVVPLVGGPMLGALLERLNAPGFMPLGTELLVVGNGPAPHRYSESWLDLGRPCNVPERRAAGWRAAKGDIVAFLEDTVEPDAGWGSAVLSLHQQYPEAQAIGGSLRMGTGLTATQQALIALDYGRFLELESGPFAAVPGNDMSFKRRALETHLADGQDLREAELLVALRAGAGPEAIRCERAMGAICVGTDARSLSLQSRFFHGRLYAGHRFTSGGHTVERLARAAVAPLLSAILAKRSLQALARTRLPNWAALPAVTAMSSAWALGESVGYLFGAGDAQAHWQ